MDGNKAVELALDFLTDRWKELRELRAADEKTAAFMRDVIAPGKAALVFALGDQPEISGEAVPLLPAAAQCIKRLKMELAQARAEIAAFKVQCNGKPETLLPGESAPTEGAAG